MNLKLLKKEKTIFILLTTIFTFNIFVSEISNYKAYSFVLKAIFSFILIILVLTDYKINNEEIAFKKLIVPNKLFVFELLVLLILPAITLTYSANPTFGALKICNLLISVIPSILAFRYLIITQNKMRIILFLNTIIFLGLLFGIVSLAISPYNPSTVYSFKITRWSHVIGGRFLSSVTVIALLLYFSNILKSKIFLISSSTILLTATYFVGLKAALLGIIILTLLIIIFTIYRKMWEKLNSISLSLLFSIVLILFISQFNHTPANRYGKLLTDNLGVINVGGVNARIIAYEKSWEVIKMHPIFGVGFGGFNNEEISGSIAKIKYPHNLLIEIQLELGIIGSLFFGILLVLMFWKSYKFSIPIFVFLLFSLWLAMFSKDISTQTQLWIGMGLIGIRRKDIIATVRKKN